MHTQRFTWFINVPTSTGAAANRVTREGFFFFFGRQEAIILAK